MTGQNDLWPLIVAVLVVLCLGFLLLILILRLVFKGARLLVHNVGLFGSSPTIRILALALSVWFFPASLSVPLNAASGLLDPLARRIPELLSHIAQLADSSTRHAIRLQIGFFALSQLCDIFASAIFSLFKSILVPQFISARVLWAVLGQVFNAIARNDEGLGLRKIYGSMSVARWQNLALFFVLLVGGYLSIASIAAIPWLRQTEEAVDTQPLATRLRESLPSHEDFNKKFPPSLTRVDPFENVSKTLDTLTSESDQATTKSGQGTTPATAASVDARGSQTIEVSPQLSQLLVSALRQTIATERESRNNLLDSWTKLQQRGFEFDHKLQETFVNSFVINSAQQRGKREHAIYARMLDDSYRRQLRDVDDQLSSCLAVISEADSGWVTYATYIEDLIKNPRQLSEPLREATTLMLLSARKPLVDLERSECESLTGVEDQPPLPPEPGSEWGPFSFVASWLLKTQSLDLALISGMLGNGVFI